MFSATAITLVPVVVGYTDVMNFCARVAGEHQPLFPTGDEVELDGNNCKVDLNRMRLIVKPAKSWSLGRQQPFRVGIHRSGTMGGTPVTIFSADSEGPLHDRAVLPLSEVIAAFNASCNHIYIWRLEERLPATV